MEKLDPKIGIQRLPREDQIFFIAGCGNDGRPCNFECRPHLGSHTIPFAAVVRSFAPDNYGDFISSDSSLNADGEIDRDYCYTADPSEECDPDFIGPYQKFKEELTKHQERKSPEPKFKIVHIDSAMGAPKRDDDTPPWEDKQESEASIDAAWNLVEEDGVLVLAVFHVSYMFDSDSGLIYEQEEGCLTEKAWIRLQAFMYGLVGNTATSYRECSQDINATRIVDKQQGGFTVKHMEEYAIGRRITTVVLKKPKTASGDTNSTNINQ